ncbi:MAG TPA: metal-dependent hydrolase [Terriglobia bacterium]|nr:metal-dependent hydrolase [Terriglobia bacterium]
MDNVTHTLVGIAIGQAGLKRKTRFAMWALIIGSNLPDIDVVSAIGGKLSYLKYHRGITHSLLGLTALAAILTALIYAFGRRASPNRNRPALSPKWLFVICWIATGCHVLMDYTNQYGVRPFLPFSGRWVALDIMPIVGPYVLLLLFLGLGIPAVLRLVSQELGVRKRDSSRAIRAGALFSLCGILGVWGLREVAHQRAVGLLSSNDYGQETPIRVGAFPSAISPFDWTGVVETGSSYYLLDLSALAAGIDADQAELLHKPGSSAALAAAQKSRGAKIFLNFARFPWATVFATEDGFDVYFRDLRFASPNSSMWGFVLEVQLNKALQIRHQSFSFFEPSPAD